MNTPVQESKPNLDANPTLSNKSGSYSVGQEPRATPAVRPAAVIFALLILSLACVLGREVWRITTEPAANSWVNPVVDAVSTETLAPWVLWSGVGAIILGLVLLFIACKPRRRTHLKFYGANSSAPEGYAYVLPQGTSAHAASEDSGPAPLSVWTRRVDVARRVSAVARSIPGVVSAQTQVSKREVALSYSCDIDDPSLHGRIENQVSLELANLGVTLPLVVDSTRVEELDINV